MNTNSLSSKIMKYLDGHQLEMTNFLSRIIELESPSDDKAAVDRLGTYLVSELNSLDARIEVCVQATAGNHILARWGKGAGGVLILCHMDTVWGLGTVAERPVRIEAGRLFGVGAEDMKGGIVIGIWALRALRELGIFPRIPITLLLTSDEETGSVTSRPIIQKEASEKQAVFVLEPAQPPNGSLKTSRKGIGDFHIAVTGRAAHAGADHEKGVNAVDELAFQVLDLRQLTNYQTGTTLNVGVTGGGTRTNVVPANAWADVDVRVSKTEESGRITRIMQSLAPHILGASIEVTGGFDRPPMVRTPAIAALFSRARNLAADLGFDLTEASAGGASDGNFTAAYGVPTLDGMGVVGDGGHSTEEYAILRSLPERAALLAAMLHSYG